MYADLPHFFDDLNTKEPESLAGQWLANPNPHAFQNPKDRDSFFAMVSDDWPDHELIQLAGTGNWRFSLNPKKSFSEFHSRSDIDVVIISDAYFGRAWNELRSVHRARWYQWDHYTRKQQMSAGQNVYCGYASPAWIPGRRNALKYRFKCCLQNYCCKEVAYRAVKMLFFKSLAEAIDYYKRGIMIARRNSDGI